MTASSRTRSSKRGFGGRRVGESLADPVAELPASRDEDLLEEVVAADGLDRGQQAGRQAVVVRREEVLRVGGDVVQVARPADAVADRLAADEVRGLERAELLEDARAAGAEPGGQLVGRARPVDPESQQQVAAEGRGPLATALSRPAARVAAASGGRREGSDMATG